MGFLSPLFLGGILAAALPIYVHLLRQHRSEPLKFSSLMFIERRTQSSIKHRRLMYLVLLAMRLAVIALLALMFANPFIRRSAAASEGRRHVVIAVDNSFSMRAGDRLARAKARAQDLIGSLRPGDRGQVFSFASQVSVLTQPTNDPAELRRAVVSIAAGDGRSAYGEIARTLRALATSGSQGIQAHVITDVQRSSMPVPFAELAVPPSVKLEIHAVAEKRETNWYVESVNAPRTVFQPKKVRVQATITGSGTESAQRPVELVLNGKTLETRAVTVPANGRVSVDFYLNDAAYGMNRGEIRLTANDSLPQDDRLPFAMERKESERILFLHDARSARSATYYRAAIESVPDAGFTAEVLSVDSAANVSPDKYAAVVLSDTPDVPPSLDSALKDYVRRGRGVLIVAGPSMAATRRVPLTGESLGDSRYASREGERFFAAGDADTSHPAVARAGGFENVRFYQIVNIDAKNGRVLARLTDGTPLMVERKLGGGKVLLFASAMDNVASDLPLHASFVPLIEQSARYLSGAESSPGQYVVDSLVDLRAARDAGTQVEVLDPDGKRALSLDEAAKMASFRLAREGFYELRRANGRSELAAVHADRRESDLDVVPKETLALWQATGSTTASGASPADSPARPYSLWWYFALALLVASLVESWFAARYLQVQGQEPTLMSRKAA